MPSFQHPDYSSKSVILKIKTIRIPLSFKITTLVSYSDPSVSLHWLCVKWWMEISFSLIVSAAFEPVVHCGCLLKKKKRKSNNLAVWDCVSGHQWPVGRHWAQLDSVWSVYFSFDRINKQLISEKRPQSNKYPRDNDKINKSLCECSCCTCYVPNHSHKAALAATFSWFLFNFLSPT